MPLPGKHRACRGQHRYLVGPWVGNHGLGSGSMVGTIRRRLHCELNHTLARIFAVARTRALEWQRLILVGLPYKSGEKHDPHGRFWHQSTSKWPAFARREWDAQVAMTVLGILIASPMECRRRQGH